MSTLIFGINRGWLGVGGVGGGPGRPTGKYHCIFNGPPIFEPDLPVIYPHALSASLQKGHWYIFTTEKKKTEKKIEYFHGLSYEL